MKRAASFIDTTRQLAEEMHRAPPPSVAAADAGRAEHLRFRKRFRRRSPLMFDLGPDYVTIEQSRKGDFGKKPETPPADEVKDIKRYWLQD